MSCKLLYVCYVYYMPPWGSYLGNGKIKISYLYIKLYSQTDPKPSMYVCM